MRRHRPSSHWTGRASAAALLTLAAAAGAPARAVPQQGPNILLVTIDTLRADRLGSYGYKAAATPVLDKLAVAGIRFADASAHAPLTHPSHAAILTGTYPGALGIRLNGMDPLPANAVTLAERLKSAGYATGAVVGSVILDESGGLSQGFDHYDDAISVTPQTVVAAADLQRSASEVTTAAVDWLANQKGRWFLWVHYYDPHLPYSAPPKYAAAAPKRPYDAEVAYVDAELGRLLRSIDAARTVVAVTGDHGEALGDHGEEDHGFFIYDATLHVPLIVAAPGVKPRVVREQVRSIDIAPTLASFAGAAWDGSAVTGENLRPLIDGGARKEIPVSIAESWYPRLHFGWSELRAIRVGEWKYIAAPKPELYDLRLDPQEARNVIQERSTVAARLAADLQGMTSRFGRVDTAPSAQPDPAAVQRLQALGYVGSFAPVTAGSSADDPKDHIAEYTQYRTLFNDALGLIGRNRPVEAAALLRKLVKTNVRAFEAHLYLGNSYFMQKRYDAALGEYDVASQLNPTLATPHFEAAKVLSVQGQTAEAVARARRGLELQPDSGYGRFTLGVIHQRAGQHAEALAEFRRAVGLNGRDARARSALAGAAMRVEDLELAHAQFEAMIGLDYQVAGAQYNLGVIAARRGDRAEAERRYKLSLAADPSFKPARDALAKIK